MKADDQIVWDVINEDLDELRQDTKALLHQAQTSEETNSK